MRTNYPHDDASLGQFLDDAYHASPEDFKNFVRLDFVQNFFRSSSNFTDKRNLLEASLAYVKNKIKKSGDLQESKKEIEAAYKVANALLLTHSAKNKRQEIYETMKEFDDFLKEAHTPAQAPPSEIEKLIPLFYTSGSLDPSLNLINLFELTVGRPLHDIVETYIKRLYTACPELKQPEYASATKLIAILLAVKHENPSFKNMTFYALFPPNSEVTLQQLNEMETAFLKLIHFNTSLHQDKKDQVPESQEKG